MPRPQPPELGRRLSAATLPLPLLLLLTVANAVTAASVQPQTLVQVTLLYRHGERTPVHTFPADPHRDLFRPLGREQLMEAGVRQHYQLGQHLRRRYGAMLPDRFNVTTMHVRSTDTDRTIMSAQANLAGLFPGQCRRLGEWTEGDSSMPACIPVPIHTVPKPFDQLLKMSSPCPAYTRRWREFKQRPGGVYQAAATRFAGLADRVRTHTRWPGRVGISELWKIGDPVLVWRTLGLPMPAWLDAEVLTALDELRHLKFAWKFSEPGLFGSRMGALVATVLGDMEARLSGRSAKVLQVYSAHDSTVSALLSAFGVFNGLQPPIAACVMLELFSDGEVRLLYRNGSDSDNTRPAQPAFCPTPCNLTHLATQMRQRGVWADTGEAMCEAGAAAAAVPTPPAASAWASACVGLVALQFLAIACLLCALLWAWRRPITHRCRIPSSASSSASAASASSIGVLVNDAKTKSS